MENQVKIETTLDAAPGLERERLQAALQKLHELLGAVVAEWAARAPLN